MTTPPFETYTYGALPEQLEHIPRDRSAVIEASAGTGKTFLIEHLVVDRLIRGDARIDEMLIVTFTERAAAELARRVRALIHRVLGAAAGAARISDGPCWTVDAAARARLEAAARAVETAPISTIHAFCQRIITEQAFAGGRLLVQRSVDSRTAFAGAFGEVLRQRIATDPRLNRYLAAYLGAGGSVAGLERLLFETRRLRAAWGMTFDADRLTRAAAGFLEQDWAEMAATVRANVAHHASASASMDRLASLRNALVMLLEDGHPARCLGAIDALVRAKNLFGYLEEKLDPSRSPAARALVDRVLELAEAAAPLDTVMARELGPLVDQRLAARKRAAGLYDFDDMLLLLRDALAGERGPGLIASLRRRFRLAIVDEFQDTDPIQWEIFRSIFQGFDAGRMERDAGDGEIRPLYLVGDPKQSIYGFRGADVATYFTACREVASAEATHRLTRNFRSTPAMIDAYNAILDQRALDPFFNAGIGYDTPVEPGLPAPETPDPRPPLTLLRVAADADVDRLPMRIVRRGLAAAIADEVALALAAPDAAPPRETFVLTRTWAEAQAAASALAAHGIAHVIYNHEGLWTSPEAKQVRDLLRAVADPHDPGKRLRAWMTPFFGLGLADLPAAAAAGGDHPLYARLYDWHAAATHQPLPRVYARILDESGAILRELFLGESARRLTNYAHLFEILSVEAGRSARPLADVVRRLSALCDGILAPDPEEGNVQRLESDRDAVQIMTMHKAKGLEADVVFVYGGFSAAGNGGVRTYTADSQRFLLAGRPRRRRIQDLIKRERDADDQRLYYVALTRARKRIYLPFSGTVNDQEDAPIEGPIKEDVWRLNGGYRHVNRRLRALASDPAARRHFAARDIPIGLQAPEDEQAPPTAVAAFRPSPADLTIGGVSPTLGRLRTTRIGPALSSYSRLKHAEGGYRPPTQILDEASEAPRPEPDELPGGARAGIFLHDVLEVVPLETLRESPRLETWIARSDIRALFEAAMRRHGRDPRHLEPAARLVHTALTSPLAVVGGTLAGIARAVRVAREMEFLFAFPPEAGGPDRGFVTGFVDVIFEHEGRSYFGDWKTDRLAAWDAATVDAHVEANYALQEKLYALALVKMLGIEDEAGYEARFGGTLYLFVRAMPGAVRGRRPSFAELRTWQSEVAARLAAGAEP
jgi:exodeoxyribonuclease V beta subunit